MTSICPLACRPCALTAALWIIAAILAVPGCSKTEAPKSDVATTQETPPAEDAAQPPAEQAAQPAADEGLQQVEGLRPLVGQTALDFKLTSLAGKETTLSDLVAKGPVVLLVMRGWVGYQCPNCTAQFADYLASSGDFSSAGAQVVMVYPGPAAEVEERANEFYSDQQLPDHFTVLLDPDMKFVSSYGLRWDKAGETAYPSTIVIGRNKLIQRVTISDSHAGRTKAAEVLATMAR